MDAMASVPALIPSARIFVGPGDSLFHGESIWVILYGGQRIVSIGWDTEKNDLQVLTDIWNQPNIEEACQKIRKIFPKHDIGPYLPNQRRCWSYFGRPQNALKGDNPLLWTIDMDQRRIFYDREGVHLMFESSLPANCSLRLRHFQPYVQLELPMHRSKQVTTVCSPMAAPKDTIPQSLYDLVYGLAKDYEYNWRNSSFRAERDGLQHIAMGILSCFTLNIDPDKIAPEYFGQDEWCAKWVDPGNFLCWRTWPHQQVITTISMGETQIIFTLRMDQAIMLVHEHFSNNILGQFGRAGSYANRLHNSCQSELLYIVTSISKIQCFRMSLKDGQTKVSCTPVETFFNGCDPPTERGVRWLLNSIHGKDYPLRTPIHDLPLELQEMIFNYAFPFERNNIFKGAILRSKLNIGIPFNFRSGDDPIVSCGLGMERELDLEECDYRIRFWNWYVGITYQVYKKGKKRQKHPMAVCIEDEDSEQ